MKKYLIVIEKTEAGYSASAPDLPGYLSTAHTREALEKNMSQALASYLDVLHHQGNPLPFPRTTGAYLEFPG